MLSPKEKTAFNELARQVAVTRINSSFFPVLSAIIVIYTILMMFSSTFLEALFFGIVYISLFIWTLYLHNKNHKRINNFYNKVNGAKK